MLLVLDLLLDRDLGQDAAVLRLHARVRRREPPQARQARQRVLGAVDQGEPPGRVGEGKDPEPEEGRGYHLQAEGDAERGLAADVAGPVRDPEGDDDAAHDRDRLEHQESASEVGR